MDAAILHTMDKLSLPRELDLSIYNNLLEVFQAAVDKYGDAPAFSSLGHTLSFRQFHRRALVFASYLQNHTDLQPGDKVAIQLPNILQYPVLLYGVMLADMVVVNINPLYTPPELRHQLKDSGAKLLIVFAKVAKTAESILAETAVEQVLITEIADFHPPVKGFVINRFARWFKGAGNSVKLPNSLALREAMRLGATSKYQPVMVSQHHLLALQYTGGTTGISKGAMLTHGNLIANILQCGSLFNSYELKQGAETVLLPLPLYHIYSFTVAMVMMEEGNHCVLVHDPRDLPSVVRLIKRYGMSVCCGINTLFVSLCHHSGFQKLDFSSLKLTLSGGMALTVDAATRWQQLTGCEIYQGYGLTETSPVITGNPGHGNRIDTIGLPLPNTEVMLCDESNIPNPELKHGELCMRGPQLMQGYWQNPEETAKVIDRQGWFHTGDIAEIDEQGYLRIVDRKKDMILVSGFNVYPNEIEDVLTEHPGVKECAAIGVPDEETGEAVKVFVVLRDASIRREQLIGFCKMRLAAYKVPRQFEFRDDLPKSTVGKILRRELR